jgi:hypothetical protein
MTHPGEIMVSPDRLHRESPLPVYISPPVSVMSPPVLSRFPVPEISTPLEIRISTHPLPVVSPAPLIVPVPVHISRAPVSTIISGNVQFSSG